MYFSQGAFTHTEVYTLPVYLRAFYYKTLSTQLEKEKEAQEKASKGKSSTRSYPPSFQNRGKTPKQ